MSYKTGILYQIGYPDNEWVEELSGKWSNNYHPNDKYEGKIENGVPTRIMIVNVSKYGTCHGQIITTYPDGRKFKGTWIDNVEQDDQRLIID
jgi:hypothetical protein